MEIIREPLDVDFVVDPRPLTKKKKRPLVNSSRHTKRNSNRRRKQKPERQENQELNSLYRKRTSRYQTYFFERRAAEQLLKFVVLFRNRPQKYAGRCKFNKP